MKSLLSFNLYCCLCAGIWACFEEQPLRSDLQKYLAQKPSCADTFFPEPPCCGSSIDTTSRIINGESTGLREQTWTVYINRTISPGEYSYCGGSLINSQWVLSAAHCFVDINSAEVHIGEWDIRTNPDCINSFCAPKVVKIKAAEIIIHRKYNDDFLPNDLALLRLERPVVYSEFINPICLTFNPLKKQCFENQKATALGWGDTEPHIRPQDDYKPSPIKLRTTLSIWETDKCDHKYHVCASGDANYTCHGDSGGPFALKLPNTDSYYLVGVASAVGPKCDTTTKFPALFAVIDFEWILDVILKTTA